MIAPRLPGNDPRTIARDIPGLFDALFPHLAQGVVTSFNRKAAALAQCDAVSPSLVATSKLQHAMLFEIAVAAAEQLIGTREAVDWALCLATAVQRQREHFDAQLPAHLLEADKKVSLRVAENLVAMLHHVEAETPGMTLVHAPRIPGYQWIASGVGDFAIGTALIEVKCSNKRFSSSDYRQLLMYWLLSYCSAIERGTIEWSHGILINPRLNLLVRFSFDEVVAVVGAGKSKVELVELFSAILGNRASFQTG
jgi:hypothetical protein